MVTRLAAASLGLVLLTACTSDEDDEVDGVPTAATGATLAGPDVAPTPVQQAWSDLYATTVDDLRDDDGLFDLPPKQCFRGERGTRLVLSKTAPRNLDGYDHRVILGLTRGSCRAEDATIEVRWSWEFGAKLVKGQQLVRRVPALREQFWRDAHGDLELDAFDIGQNLQIHFEDDGRYPATYTQKDARRDDSYLTKGLTFTYHAEDDGTSYRLCVTHPTGAWRTQESGLLPTAVGDEGDCSFDRQAPDSTAGLLVDAERLIAQFEVPPGDTPRTCDDLPDTTTLVNDGVLSPGNTVADCATREYEAKVCVENSGSGNWLALGDGYLEWETGTGTCKVAGLAKRVNARDIWTRSEAS